MAKRLAKFVHYNKVSYIKVLFHIFFYYWDKENCSLYRDLLGCIEVRYIEVPLYYHFIAQNNSYNIDYLSP